MREIKFKLYLQQEETGRITTKTFSYAEIFSGEAIRELETTFIRYAVIGRAENTGLKDKSGKEIYEGDIVEYSNFNGHQFRRVVVYLEPNFVLSPSISEKIAVDTFSTPNIHETIIGNIYQNHELLSPTE